MSMEPREHYPLQSESIASDTSLIVPGKRTPDDLPVGLPVFSAIADHSNGGIHFTTGAVVSSKYPSARTRLAPEDPNRGVVRVGFSEPPYALVTDTTSCSIVPVAMARELVDNADLQEQWFTADRALWMKKESPDVFIGKLAAHLAIAELEQSLKSTASRRTRYKSILATQ